MMFKPVLYYVYDPMCSWCWGYQPVWLSLQEKLKGVIDIQYRVGGLAPDSDSPMPKEMQVSLQQIWQTISQQLGTKFNFDFWSKCKPKRSTYPACRAMIIAREFNQEKAFYFAVQQAYYLQAKNPSDVETLVDIAHSLGIDKNFFEKQLQENDVTQKLMAEIEVVRKMPIQGFPSLVLYINEQYIAIPIDYLYWEKTYKIIMEHLNE